MGLRVNVTGEAEYRSRGQLHVVRTNNGVLQRQVQHDQRGHINLYKKGVTSKARLIH